MMPFLIRFPAVAAVLTLTAVLAGCATTATSTQPPSVSATTVARFDGAGSTFDAPFFNLAFSAYEQANIYVGINYDAVGSSAGITQFATGKVNFGATDVPASDADLVGVTGITLQVPVDLGAVAVAYSGLHLGGKPLRLTGPVLARIFLGQITRWDDAAIVALNPGANLPHAAITVVHRADGSGTSYIFSDYLSAVSPAWAAQVGTGRTLRWPAGVGGTGNAGVTTALENTPYSIGYVERSYTSGTDLSYAAIANRDGIYTTPTPAAISADAAAKPAISVDSFSIVNEPGADAYPICGYSWVLISASQPTQSTGQALVSLLYWLTHAGQAYAANLGYVPLPPVVRQLAESTLAEVTGPAGVPLTG